MSQSGESESVRSMTAPTSVTRAHVVPVDEERSVIQRVDQVRTRRNVGGLHARLAELFDQVANVHRELSMIQLDDPRETRLMGDVKSVANMPSERESFLTVNDVAKLLQVDGKTVRRWRKEGKLPPAFANGSIVRWKADVIDAWIVEQEESP